MDSGWPSAHHTHTEINWPQRWLSILFHWPMSLPRPVPPSFSWLLQLWSKLKTKQEVWVLRFVLSRLFWQLWALCSYDFSDQFVDFWQNFLWSHSSSLCLPRNIWKSHTSVTELSVRQFNGLDTCKRWVKDFRATGGQVSGWHSGRNIGNIT